MVNCKAKEKDKITHKTKPRSNCPSNQVEVAKLKYRTSPRKGWPNPLRKRMKR